MPMGRAEVQATERFQSPWDRSRRDRLLRVVRDTHKRNPLLNELVENYSIAGSMSLSLIHVPSSISPARNFS